MIIRRAGGLLQQGLCDLGMRINAELNDDSDPCASDRRNIESPVTRRSARAIALVAHASLKELGQARTDNDPRWCYFESH